MSSSASTRQQQQPLLPASSIPNLAGNVPTAGAGAGAGVGPSSASVKRVASTSSKVAAGQPSGIKTPTHQQSISATATPNPQQRFALARLKARKEAAVFFKSVESWNNEAVLGGSLDDLSKVAKGITGSVTGANQAGHAANRQMKKAMSIIPGAANDEANQAIMLVWDTPMFHKFRLFSLLFTFIAFILTMVAIAWNRFATFANECIFGLWDYSYLGELGDKANALFDSINNSTLMSDIGRGIQGADHGDGDYSSGGQAGCIDLPPEFQVFFGWRIKVLFVYAAYLLSSLIACFAIIFAQCGRGGNLRKYVYRIHSTAELLIVNELLLAGTTTYVCVKLRSEPSFIHFSIATYVLLAAVAMQTLGTFLCSFDNLLVTCSEVCCPAYHRRTQKFVASQASTAAYRL